ncbi:flagellar motor protein MotB [Candidatus Magnetoovum chiemensis]|nr:flagellar motor protein MotB [Candidatus Magnetoovum chiemensis]
MKGQNIIIIKKVKKKKHAAHHGGQWKVAYADFVTAMMALFLMLWLITMVSPEKQLALSNYFTSLSVYEQFGISFLGQGSGVLAVKTGTDQTSMFKKSPSGVENITDKSVSDKGNLTGDKASSGNKGDKDKEGDGAQSYQSEIDSQKQ